VVLRVEERDLGDHMRCAFIREDASCGGCHEADRQPPRDAGRDHGSDAGSESVDVGQAGAAVLLRLTARFRAVISVIFGAPGPLL
jgi:hypothetical protein